MRSFLKYLCRDPTFWVFILILMLFLAYLLYEIMNAIPNKCLLYEKHEQLVSNSPDGPFVKGAVTRCIQWVRK